MNASDGHGWQNGSAVDMLGRRFSGLTEESSQIPKTAVSQENRRLKPRVILSYRAGGAESVMKLRSTGGLLLREITLDHS